MLHKQTYVLLRVENKQQKMNTALQLKQHDDVLSQEIGLEILSFYQEDNTPLFSDMHLAQIFRRIVREETLHDTFYDGYVRNTKDFVKFVKNNEMYFVKLDREDVGFFWLSKFSQKSSFVTYCLYKKFWGKKALTISKFCIDFILNRRDSRGEYLLDVVLGLTPTTNKLAIKLLMKIGMTVVGKIPGILYNAKEHMSVDGLFSYKQRNGKSKIHIPTLFSLYLN